VKPLILLHGFTGHADCFGDLIDQLPHGRDRARAYTLLGHAWEAPDVPLANTFEEEVDRVADLIRHDCTGKVTLCGYSLGGRVALVLLARHPELVASAILIGVNPGLESEQERTARAAGDGKWIRMLKEQGLEAFIDAWEAQPMFASQRRLAENVQLDQRRRRIRHDPKGLATSMDVLGLSNMPNMWPELRNLHLPVHLVVGELDAKFRGIAETMVTRMPSARLHVIAGSGHNVVLEKPAALIAILADA
jgi:2-succinyl-6-hydroxy-2,4-cyclohexadiene-1-carboxylate synthase